jgi:hypothetical protein
MYMSARGIKLPIISAEVNIRSMANLQTRINNLSNTHYELFQICLTEMKFSDDKLVFFGVRIQQIGDDQHEALRMRISIGN